MSLEWARARAFENAARRNGLVESASRTYSLEINFASSVIVTLSRSDAKSYQGDLMKDGSNRRSVQPSANDGSWSIVARATPNVRRMCSADAIDVIDPSRNQLP